jgi:hypothetical protein
MNGPCDSGRGGQRDEGVGGRDAGTTTSERNTPARRRVTFHEHRIPHLLMMDNLHAFRSSPSMLHGQNHAPMPTVRMRRGGCSFPLFTRPRCCSIGTKAGGGMRARTGSEGSSVSGSMRSINAWNQRFHS